MRRQDVWLPFACGHTEREDVAAGASPQTLALRVREARGRICPACRIAAEEAARKAQETPETRRARMLADFPD